MFFFLHMSGIFRGWIRFIGSTVNSENIRLISSGESSRNEMRAEILFTMPVGMLDVEEFMNEHFRREKDVATVAVRKGQFDVIWGKNEAPCLFDLKEKFCFQSAERKIQLMTIQEFGVREDSLLFTTLQSWDRNLAASHHKWKRVSSTRHSSWNCTINWCQESRVGCVDLANEEESGCERLLGVGRGITMGAWWSIWTKLWAIKGRGLWQHCQATRCPQKERQKKTSPKAPRGKKERKQTKNQRKLETADAQCAVFKLGWAKSASRV